MLTNIEKCKRRTKTKPKPSGVQDGRWYKRAYMDDGNVLGTIQNDECKIDNIAQCWSVISGAGDNDKKYISVESLEKYQWKMRKKMVNH